MRPACDGVMATSLDEGVMDEVSTLEELETPTDDDGVAEGVSVVGVTGTVVSTSEELELTLGAAAGAEDEAEVSTAGELETVPDVAAADDKAEGVLSVIGVTETVVRDSVALEELVRGSGVTVTVVRDSDELDTPTTEDGDTEELATTVMEILDDVAGVTDTLLELSIELEASGVDDTAPVEELPRVMGVTGTVVSDSEELVTLATEEDGPAGAEMETEGAVTGEAEEDPLGWTGVSVAVKVYVVPLYTSVHVVSARDVSAAAAVDVGRLPLRPALPPVGV